MYLPNLLSFMGIWMLMGIAWLFSPHKRVINWRAILWGVGLQLSFALFIFLVPSGSHLFYLLNGAVNRLLENAAAGSQFLFGRLALPPGTANPDGESSLGFFLVFQAFPIIVFFAALIELLYQLRIMPVIIRFFARIFTRLMRISGAESLCVSSEIFVGIESSLTVRPYLSSMTRSELCTILTAGMGTIASSVMAIYVFMLQKEFPGIAGHLLSASLISAPACIVMSKLVCPETGKPVSLGVNIPAAFERHGNWVEAVIKGAQNGVRLVVGVSALLLAFLGLMALADTIFGLIAGRINVWFGTHLTVSLKGFLGYLFYPLTRIIGVPGVDAWQVSRLIGERVIATELVSYRHLAQMLAAKQITDPRSAVIAVYALCGFAHVASMAIFVGGVSALVPERTREIALIGFRALLAATLACLMTGAVAGVFFSQSSILFGR